MNRNRQRRCRQRSGALLQWVSLTLAAAAAVASANAQNVTANLISGTVRIRHFCGTQGTSTTSSDIGPIAINENPFGCQPNRQYSVNGQALPNLPASLSGTLDQSGTFMSLNPAANVSMAITVDFTTGANEALKPEVRAKASTPTGCSYDQLDKRERLPVQSTTRLQATASGSCSSVRVDPDSTIEFNASASVSTLMSGTSDLFTGVTYDITARYKVGGPPGGCPECLTLDQKLAARGTTIRLNIRGQDFTSNSVPAFLNEETNTVDPDLILSEVTLVSATEIQALLFVAPNALGTPKTLRVTSGATTATLRNALSITSFKLALTQGAQTTLTEERIANHPTVVRAGAQYPLVGPGLPEGMSGLLYVFDGETQISGSPFVANKSGRPDLNSDVLQAKSTYTDEDLFFLRETLNFYFGMGAGLPSHDALDGGSHKFVLAVSPTDPARPPPRLSGLSRSEVRANREFIVFDQLPEQTFVTTRPFRLYVIVDPRLSSEKANGLYNFHDQSFEYLAAAFPIDGSRSKLVIQRAAFSTLDIEGLRPQPGEIMLWADKILDRMAEILANLNGGRPAEHQFDKIVLMTDSHDLDDLTADRTNPDIAGLAQTNGTACLFGGLNRQALAHELGHTLGLDDTYQKYPPPSRRKRPPNPRHPGAPSGGNLVEYGTERLAELRQGVAYPAASAAVDADGEVLPQIPYRFFSLMGGAATNWPDVAEWKYLDSKFRLGGGTLAAKGAAPRARAVSVATELVHVGGSIDVNDNVTVRRVRRAVLPFVVPDPGDYTLELLDGSGQSLSATSFAIDFNIPHLGLVSETSFNVGTPYVAGAAAVRIRKGSNVLYLKPISPNSPSVQIFSPSGGEALGGLFTISWTGSDPDGDALTYSIVYLRDDGSPDLIADRLSSTSFQWNDPSLSGGSSSGRLVVTANDGVNEGGATSATFSVNRRGPVVTIIEPANGAAVPANTPTAISGAGSDSEDGYLPGSALSFRSSIDGDLGTGGTITPALSQGTHTITLRGVDSDGVAAEVSITLVAGPAASVPAIDRVSPAAAPAGATITLAGRNFSAGATVRLGTTAASVLSVSANQIVVTIPAGLPLGEAELSVTSAGFTTNTIVFKITYGRPFLSGLTPNSGSPGTPVFLSGAEFAPSPEGNTVRFGSATATVLGAGLEGMLVVVPAGLNPGGTSVTVTTSQGVSNPLPFIVTSGQPSTPVIINSISPSSASVGAIVTINGTGFSNVLNNNGVSFGATIVTPISGSSTSLQVAVPFGLPAGTVNLIVSVHGYPSNPLPFTVTTGTNPTPTPGCGTPGKVAFSSSRDGNNEIYLMNPDGSGQVRLTNNPALDYTPAWSPDGTRIAFASDRDGNQEIYVMNADGSGQTRLTNNPALDYFPAWSPDGARIAFTRQVTATNLEIFLMNANGTGEVNITNNPKNDQQPAWSPDGTKLVFGSDRDDTHLELYTMNANGSGVTRLTNNPGGVDYYPAWSPDGTKIAFATDRVSNPHSYDFALEVFVMNANGTNQTNLTNNGRSDLNPAWAPDGSKIVFISDRDTAQYVPQLYSMNPDGTGVTRLTNNAAADASPVWSAAQCNPTSAVREVQNISTRVVVGTGENVAIGGFIILGTGSKSVIVRAIGPSLANFGVNGALEDPTLELFNGSGNAIAFNDDWLSSGQNQEIAALLPPGDGVEAAIIASLAAGNYTAVLRGYENGTGIALVEVYDLDQGAPSRLANISTRGQVGTGGSVLIGGFIVGKQAQFVVRAIGPSLGAAGIGNALGNPILELYNGQGTKFDTNDNWQEHPSAGQVSGLGLAPGNGLESAIMQTLSPGNYTAIVRGLGDGTGVGLVEVYSLQ